MYVGAGEAGYTFQRPGAVHKARWMAKLLYVLKLALMKQHIACLPRGTITKAHQVVKIQAFAIFIVHIYTTWWLTCDKPLDAAWNDLVLFQNLIRYKAVHEEIANSAIKALKRHRWYLTAEMIPLALFNEKVPTDERRALADAILENKPEVLPVNPIHRFGNGFGKPDFPELTAKTRLADLANQDSWFGMQQLHINADFLPRNVDEWPASETVQSINVVNDCAERGVKLTSDYVSAARSEDHLQNVLQAVESDRRQHPNLRKRKGDDGDTEN